MVNQMHDKKDIFGEIIRLGKVLDAKDQYKDWMINYNALWETEYERTQRRYDEGKITKEEAFLGLL